MSTATAQRVGNLTAVEILNSVQMFMNSTLTIEASIDAGTMRTIGAFCVCRAKPDTPLIFI
jgi:hypothetical protein